jgi:hypothetical protein
MTLVLTLAFLKPGHIVLLVIAFVIGRWVYGRIQEARAQTRRDGLENPNQNVQSPTSDQGRAMRSGGESQGDVTGGGPTNLSVSEHAEREKARQQYAERAERLRAQRLGKAMPGAAGGASAGASTPMPKADGSDQGWVTTPSPARPPQSQSQSQAPMTQSRPLPTQQAKALPTNTPAHQAPSTQKQWQPAPAPQTPVKQTQRTPSHASGPEAIIPGAPAGVGISDVSQQQARASRGQLKASQPSQQAARVTSQAPVQHTLGRIGTIEDLRRAVVLREILDPPVSLRE